MGMKDVKTTIKAQNLNHEGVPAYKREGMERLREILFLGNTGNTFYVNNKKMIEERIKDIEKLVNQLDSAKVAEVIVAARNEGFMRTMPIIALIYLRKRDVKEFKRIFNDVIKTGNDMKDFLDLNNSIQEGFGRAVKTAINKWLEDVNEFYALKYRHPIADAISIARPKVDKFKNKDILSYVYNKEKKNKTVITEKIKQIKAAEEFKKLVDENEILKALEIAEKHHLPADLIIGIIGNRDFKEIWKVIEENMGTMMFIKYINKLTKVLGEKYVAKRIKERLTPETIRKAKIFPYRVFVAYVNAKNEKVKNALGKVINIYEKEKIINEKWMDKEWAICPDISGSMTYGAGGVRPIDIAGFFASIMAKQLEVDKVIAWDNMIKKINTIDKTILGIYEKMSKYMGGGTDMAKPIKELTLNKEKKDIVVIVTDSEHWVNYWDGNTVQDAWKEYKNEINPEAKLVVIEIVGYGNSTVDEEFAEKYDVYTVFGWNESVFKWIEMKVLE